MAPAGAAALVVDAAGYTRTSVALRDAPATVDALVVGERLTRIQRREPYRHRSRVAEVCDATICGAGVHGPARATPIGMARHPDLPLPAAPPHPGLRAAGVVHRPLGTELLGEARAPGRRTLDGGGMAVFQAAHAFRLSTGREPGPAGMPAPPQGRPRRRPGRSPSCASPSPPSPSAAV
ncbi:type II 3-dehydroquinate dehydratase [Streptomyces altiplanensis]